MSLDSWKEEFYQVDAEDVSEEDALGHSLKKWIGALPQNLEKHGLEKEKGNTDICDGHELFPFDTETCSLCVHYFGTTKARCNGCPLFINGYRCFDVSKQKDGSGQSPYYAFINDNDPEPMINLIKKAIELKKPITHVVQAVAFFLGWVDCRACTSEEKAKEAMAELIADDDAWMPDTPKDRISLVRIVPVAESRCADAYRRK